jgi:glucose-1-phosphate thymidylyltransferase
VSEYLVERMILGGADKLCFVIAPGKCDILQYFGASYGGASTAFVVQPKPGGLCDAIFRADVVLNDDEPVLVGLPDTIWFPRAALNELPEDGLSFLLFPVEQPQLFDAVVLHGDRVVEIQVKQQRPASHWIWGAFKMPGTTFRELRRLWEDRGRSDEYFGTLVNAYLAGGGTARGIRAGEAYVDVGTLHGYQTAISFLAGEPQQGATLLQAAPSGAAAGIPQSIQSRSA